RTALVGYYKILNEVNGPYHRVKLHGLQPDLLYCVDDSATHYGDELMEVGLLTTDGSSGQAIEGDRESKDFDSRIFVLHAQ
uniref:GH36 C-terminal domain-containing protein n=1 Tax=Butyricicoccus sp. TaxID=2049021 RepID=UPI003D7DB1FC